MALKIVISRRNHKRAGLFPKELEKPCIGKEESFKWLKKGKSGYENEKSILAAQDQGLMTNSFKKKTRISQNDQCCYCHAAVESTSHHYKIDTQPIWLHEPRPTIDTEKFPFSTTNLCSPACMLKDGLSNQNCHMGQKEQGGENYRGIRPQRLQFRQGRTRDV